MSDILKEIMDTIKQLEESNAELDKAETELFGSPARNRIFFIPAIEIDRKLYPVNGVFKEIYEMMLKTGIEVRLSLYVPQTDDKGKLAVFSMEKGQLPYNKENARSFELAKFSPLKEKK